MMSMTEVVREMVKTELPRFDYKDNREVEESETELKRVVNEQQKQLSNLRAQVC